MSDTVAVCPECDSSHIRVWSAGEHTPRYTCEDCDHRFDTPERRPPRWNTDGRRGLSKRLVEANPDEVVRP